MNVAILFAVYVLVTADGANARVVDPCKISPMQTCELFTFGSDLVSAQDLINQNMTSDGWIMLYGSIFDSSQDQSHGKCNYKWTHSKQDNTIQRQAVCYNPNLGICESFDAKLTWQDCNGRVKEVAVDHKETGTYYSQDIQQYLVYYSCVNETSSDTCDIEYLDVLVRDYRYKDSIGKELDLQGIPWHLIAADLKKNFKYEFSSPVIEYLWKGPECDFHGRIVPKETNDAPRARIEAFILFIVMIMTFNF